MTAQSTKSGLPRLGVAPLTQYLAAANRLDGTTRQVVLLRSVPAWVGPAELTWGDSQRARVADAPSPLAVHECILGHLEQSSSDTPPILVVLTDREERELDPGLLARVYRGRIGSVDNWEVVREGFGASSVDPRLKAFGWAAESLLDATPPGGWPRVPGGQLSARHALTQLALRRLGIGRYGETDAASEDALDIHALLRWTLTSGGPERLLALRAAERDGLRDFLGEPDQAGQAGRALLNLVDTGHGADAVAFGLVAAALWVHADPQAEVYRARGRAEQWLGERPTEASEDIDARLATFGQACEEYTIALIVEGRGAGESARAAQRMTGPTLARAETLVRQFGAQTAAASSPVLRSGLEARFAAVGKALELGTPTAVSLAVRRLGAHELAGESDTPVRLERARMAQRLTQWLAHDPSVEVETVAAGIERHIAETGWLDMAVEHLEAGGEQDPQLKVAYDNLGSRLRLRRRALDSAFARRLATWTEAGSDPGAMLTVETFLKRIVAPIVRGPNARRVMLIVIDGMSAAIANELGEQLRAGWAEYDPLPATEDSRAPRRRGMAAALPTLTTVSRTSLFAGRLMRGTQADEKRLFPTHRFWAGIPAAAFHKDDLRGETTGDPFGPALAAAIGDGHTHVAVVLNTVDDRLAKEQKLGDASWGLDEIGGLRALLSAAASQGMAVLLTSDHGHVIDRRSVRIDGTGVESARHRAAGDPLRPAEIGLSGPRVVWPESGASIVALWDADTRYASRQAGYHGGATLAEFTIPVLAFLPFEATPPKAWRELGPQTPSWWTLEEDTDLPSTAAARLHALKKPVQRRHVEHHVTASRDALFDVTPVPERETALTVSPDAALLATLLASEIFAAQVGVLARKPRLEQIEKALAALLDAGGTLPVQAIAQRADVPATRADGFAAVLRQLLNYDGVQVIQTLPDGRTLRLHSGLLKEQFGIG